MVNYNNFIFPGFTFHFLFILGIWKDKQQLKEFHRTEQIFIPSTSEEYKNKCQNDLHKWMVAADRFKSWYKEN